MSNLFCKLLCLSVLAYPLNAMSTNNLPSLGSPVSAVISLDTEYRLGQGLIRQIRGTDALLEDPIVESYLSDLVWDLVPNSQLQTAEISLAVIDNPNINAFAAPGGIIGINAGLVLAAQREDELASVISHELAHLSQRHFAGRLARDRANTPFAIASLIGGIVVAAANPEAGSAVLMGGIAKNQSAALAFSRNNEQEADRLGMQTLVSSGFDPNAMPRMFERLLEKQRLQGSNPPEFLLTHPTSISRIADTKNRAVKLGFGHRESNTLEFKIVQTLLKTKYSISPSKALKQYAIRLQKDASASNTLLYAAAASAARKPKEALSTLRKLPPTWKQHLYIQIMEAQLLGEDSQWDKALDKLKRIDQNYPQNLAVQMVYAKSLFDSQQYANALTLLKSIVAYAPQNMSAWYYLSETYGKLDMRHQTHRARVNYFLLRGQTKSAKRQITFARRERTISSSDMIALDYLEDQLQLVEGYMNTQY